MDPLSRPVLLLLAALLVLAGMGLYRWLATANKAQPPAQPVAVAVSGLPRLVELGSDSCSSCIAMRKVLAELRQRHAGRLRVESINVIEDPRQVGQWKVMAIPTQVFLDGQGREIHRHLGYLSAQAAEERFRRHGIDLGGTSASGTGGGGE